MTCRECSENLVAYVEGLLDEPSRRQLEEHLRNCPACQEAAEDCRRLHDQLTSRGRAATRPSLDDAVMDRIFREQTHQVRRFAMFRRHARATFGLAAAAAVLIAAGLLFFGPSQPAATAAEVLNQAIQAISNLRTLHIKANMRTIAHDNFHLIGTQYGMVPMELWKDFGPPVSWRAEKSGRVMVAGNGEFLLLIRPDVGFRKPLPKSAEAIGPSGALGWLGLLLEPEKVLEAEKLAAQANHWPLTLTEEPSAAGAKELVLTVEAGAEAEGQYTNNYLKNSSIADADTRRIYRVDPETKRLEGVQVYVREPGRDTLVFEITDIEYDSPLDASVFTIQMPENVRWVQEPQVLPENAKYEAMTPEQVAAAFFQACADENWDEVAKFWPIPLDEKFKQYVGGLQVVSLGKAFQSGRYPHWFVPYEIKLRLGETKKHNLALRNDNPAKRYLVDGGI